MSMSNEPLRKQTNNTDRSARPASSIRIWGPPVITATCVPDDYLQLPPTPPPAAAAFTARRCSSSSSSSLCSPLLFRGPRQEPRHHPALSAPLAGSPSRAHPRRLFGFSLVLPRHHQTIGLFLPSSPPKEWTARLPVKCYNETHQITFRIPTDKTYDRAEQGWLLASVSHVARDCPLPECSKSELT
ncbi:hypothetical protein CKAH01_04110 [Colletotrichum kahawae]|uniref:Uncharacterized protein n=1 Tax=Colletotrichum kahawae TaxID=34407 RepID=A0AAD9YKN8_COLKA|nr:hypothetical protein CKAH01_04110 [Colletotrichum kahawae]